MKKFLIFIMCLCSIGASAQSRLRSIDNYLLTYSANSVSIHDPSIVYNENDKYYYIVGSHMGLGKSKDLVDWQSIDNGKWVVMPDWWENYQDGSFLFNTTFWEAFKSNPTHEVKLANGSTGTLKSYDAGHFCSIYAANDSAWIKGDMWAPDVIYNKELGKWCFYLSLNGDNWASVIVLMTGDSPVGPFTYEAPIVFGGFNNYTYSGKKVDYKNTDLELVWGTLNSLPARYNVGKSWGTYYPNCIDPNVFYDEDGELWLVYGSWSGGIYSLKLDKNTGLRDYTVTYGNKTSTSPSATGDDPYFGKKIAGGYYVSGEGPYIRHIGDYYYLFMSYGGFAPGGYDEKGKPQGGYEMRIFRSDSPTGPFKDASGNLATYTSYQMNYGPSSQTNKGMKIIGAYNGWGNLSVGECSQGHNSAIVGADGEAYVVFHTKFNDGTNGHLVRVHRLYVNENGWLVCSPFPYRGETNIAESTSRKPAYVTRQSDIETTQPLSAEAIAGTYTYIRHPYRLDYAKFQESTPVEVTLTEDGKITGGVTGTWKYSQDGKSYVTITVGAVTYYGVLNMQNLSGTDQSKGTADGSGYMTVCLSAVSNAGAPVWLYKLDDRSQIVDNVSQYQRYFSTNPKTTDAPTPKHDVKMEYETSNASVFTTEGKLIIPSEDTNFTAGYKINTSTYYYQDLDYQCQVLGDPTGISTVKPEEKKEISKSSKKVVENGKIVIYRDGKRYNMQGQRIN